MIFLLFEKHLKGILQEDEKQLLAKMLKLPENQLYLASKIDEQFFDQSLEEIGTEEVGKQIYQGIRERLREAAPQKQTIQQPASVVEMPRYRRNVFRSIAVAATIILVIGLGIIFLINKKPGEQAVAFYNNNKHVDSALSILYYFIFTASFMDGT